MISPHFLGLIVTGFTIALLHAAIPTHWLPFVMVGRARGWSTRQVLRATVLAGGGHVATTTLLGVGLAWFGVEINEQIEDVFRWLVAGFLVAIGAWIAFRAPHGIACTHCQGTPARYIPDPTDRAALWGLFLTLTLSPCELFLPIYLTAVPYGWAAVAWLSAVLAFATLGSMVALTWLTLRSFGGLRWSWLQNPNRRVVGGMLCLLGVITALANH